MQGRWIQILRVLPNLSFKHCRRNQGVPNGPFLGCLHDWWWTIGQWLLNRMLCISYGFLYLSGLSFADCGFVELLPLIVSAMIRTSPTVRALRCKDNQITDEDYLSSARRVFRWVIR
jgi:hypothetical protein